VGKWGDVANNNDDDLRDLASLSFRPDHERVHRSSNASVVGAMSRSTRGHGGRRGHRAGDGCARRRSCRARGRAGHAVGRGQRVRDDRRRLQLHLELSGRHRNLLHRRSFAGSRPVPLHLHHSPVLRLLMLVTLVAGQRTGAESVLVGAAIVNARPRQRTPLGRRVSVAGRRRRRVPCDRRRQRRLRRQVLVSRTSKTLVRRAIVVDDDVVATTDGVRLPQIQRAVARAPCVHRIDSIDSSDEQYARCPVDNRSPYRRVFVAGAFCDTQDVHAAKNGPATASTQYVRDRSFFGAFSAVVILSPMRHASLRRSKPPPSPIGCDRRWACPCEYSSTGARRPRETRYARKDGWRYFCA